MRAAVLADRSLRVIERARPAPGPGEVLLRAPACGVCRTDVHIVVGVVEPGLFIGMAEQAIVGQRDGGVRVLRRER